MRGVKSKPVLEGQFYTVGDRVVGRLVSTPYGYRLDTTNNKLHWFRCRYFKSPADLVTAVDMDAA